jgi:putative endonuclease
LSRKVGSEAEEKAVLFLEKNGFKVVEKNFYSRFGEIDIIAKKDDVLHFIEVKSGKGEPVYKVTPSKLSKIIKTSEFYLNKTRSNHDYCFDAVIVKDDNIEFIENISFY